VLDDSFRIQEREAFEAQRERWHPPVWAGCNHCGSNDGMITYDSGRVPCPYCNRGRKDSTGKAQAIGSPRPC
jgi:hypothetical protein